jgi:hypothetical protein
VTSRLDRTESERIESGPADVSRRGYGYDCEYEYEYECGYGYGYEYEV